MQILLRIRWWPALVCFVVAGCAGGEEAASDTVHHTPIHAVQGSGDESPLLGRSVTVAGIVTGDFQDHDADARHNLGGFFLQDSSGDTDPATSEGLFIDDSGAPATDVQPGNRAVVTGQVVEQQGETRLVAVSVAVRGAGTVTPARIELPTAGTATRGDGEPVADLERFEGMLVSLEGTLTVSDLYSLERFGEMTLSAGGRLYQFTNGNRPDEAGFARHRERVAARSLILDDGLLRQNTADSRYRLPEGAAIRAGDAVSRLTGVLRYGRGSGDAGAEGYRLEPTVAPQFRAGNPRPEHPPDPGGQITVASFNVLNYFTTVDDGAVRCGPTLALGCRGADSRAELARQRAKLLFTLNTLDADVLGLMEVENNGGAALRDLTDGLNALAGEDRWAHVATGHIGTDAIAVGLIYKRSAVRPVGEFATLNRTLDARFIDTRNRPPLAQTFAAVTDGARLTVVVNHLKSKGSPCDDLGDPDRADGQANCNLTRLNAVRAIIDWLEQDPTGSGDRDMLVIGDLNAYLAEDPVLAFEEAGYRNLLRQASGDKAYSYVFAGQAGALDHAFASPSLAGQVAGIAVWHINADEAPLLDYNLDFGRDAAWFDAGSPFRTSDHDPVIVGLDLDRDLP